MAITVRVDKQISEELYCKQCNGSCWVPGNNKETQAAAKKMFGITPNLCVNESKGHIKCPHSK